jgi:tetratricopeptide (TPR) repeat protein
VHLQDRLKKGATKDSCPGLVLLTTDEKLHLRDIAQWEYDESIAKYRKRVDSNPKDAYAYFNWGIALYDQGRHNEAIEKFRQAVDLDPRLGYAYIRWEAARLEKTRNHQAR